MENHSRGLPSHFPAFRHSVALQMEAYRERIARRIQAEAAKHGESPADLAHALQVHPSTTERWFRAERTPQPRLRKQLAQHWALPPDEFEPDLEAEDREVRAQLDRIEEKLDEILERLPVKESAADEAAEDVERELADQEAEQDEADEDETGTG